MPEPVTLTVLGGVAAAEGIKFLYGQASELLRAWRERGREPETAPTEFHVPVIDSTALDGRPTSDSVDVSVLREQHKALVQLTGALSPYAHGHVDIEPSDDDLPQQVERLRTLLEAAYGQRFTFVGETRDPTGAAVTVMQVLGEVRGSVTGAEADVAASGRVDVSQDVATVAAGGAVTGFKGRIGTPPSR